MKNTHLVIAALAMTASASSFAERPNTYVFVNALYNSITTDIKDTSTVDPARTGSNATEEWSIDPAKPNFAEEGDVSDTSAGFRVGGGINFAEHWGMELAFNYYGEAVDTLKIDGANDIELTTKARSISVDVIRYFDITNDFSLYGKAGIDAWTTDIRAQQRGKQADSDKDSDYMPSIAFGARYALNNNIDLNAELGYRFYNAEYTQFAQVNNPDAVSGTEDLNTEGRYEKIGTDVEIVSFSVGAAYRF